MFLQIFKISCGMPENFYGILQCFCAQWGNHGWELVTESLLLLLLLLSRFSRDRLSATL